MFFLDLCFWSYIFNMICESLRCINMLILCMGIVLVSFEFGLLMWTYYNARHVSLVWTFQMDRLLLLCTTWSLFMCSQCLQVTNSSLFLFTPCLQVTDRSLASLLMCSWQFWLPGKIRSGCFLNKNAYLWRNWQAALKKMPCKYEETASENIRKCLISELKFIN